MHVSVAVVSRILGIWGVTAGILRAQARTAALAGFPSHLARARQGAALGLDALIRVGQKRATPCPPLCSQRRTHSGGAGNYPAGFVKTCAKARVSTRRCCRSDGAERTTPQRNCPLLAALLGGGGAAPPLQNRAVGGPIFAWAKISLRLPRTDPSAWERSVSVGCGLDALSPSALPMAPLTWPGQLTIQSIFRRGQTWLTKPSTRS